MTQQRPFPAMGKDAQSSCWISRNSHSAPSVNTNLNATIFTSYCNPKGDADTERVICTIKEDLLWTNEFRTLDELQDRLRQWQHDYNHVFPYSSLEYCTPVEYEELWHQGKAPQNTRAKKFLRNNPLFWLMEQNRGLCNDAP